MASPKPAPAAAISLFLFRLLGRPLFLLHLLDRGCIPLVLLAFSVQVVEVERVDDLLLLEQELLHLATYYCRDATRLFPILFGENIPELYIRSFIVKFLSFSDT